MRRRCDHHQQQLSTISHNNSNNIREIDGYGAVQVVTLLGLVLLFLPVYLLLLLLLRRRRRLLFLLFLFFLFLRVLFVVILFLFFLFFFLFFFFFFFFFYTATREIFPSVIYWAQRTSVALLIFFSMSPQTDTFV